MARESGRGLVLERASGSPAVFATIKALRTKNPTISREPIDVTTDDDGGWRATSSSTTSPRPESTTLR